MKGFLVGAFTAVASLVWAALLLDLLGLIGNGSVYLLLAVVFLAVGYAVFNSLNKK